MIERRRRPAAMVRLTTAAAAASLVVAGLAACGGGAAEPADPDASSSTDAASPSADTTTALDAAYLPTPDGVTLTEPGTELAVKDDAVAAWTPRQDLVGVVEVAVTRIERTTARRSFDGYDLPAGVTPYFVRTTVANVGETDLGARRLPLYVIDDADTLVEPSDVDPAFEPCAGATLPAVFAPDDEARSCLVFLLPDGAELAAVTFRPPEGVVPLTWTGEVQQPRRERGRARS